MQTTDTYDLVSTSFEACAAFGAGTGGSPVCAECGWLDVEHVSAVAEVHELAARRQIRVTPKRLAS
jgi:hypothetical protein